MRRLVVLAAVLTSGQAASAQSLPPRLDAAAGQAIVQGCAAAAGRKSQSHAIVVVDSGGATVAALRMDGNGPGIYAFAEQKAKASAAWGFPTARMAEAAKETPGFASAPYVVTVPGGLPVYDKDGRIQIGAVGVSGEAPADDQACAEAGIVAAGLRSSRAR